MAGIGWKKKTYRAVRGLEHVKAALHGIPHGVAGALEHGLGIGRDAVPQRLVLVACDHDNAHGLRVVGRGREREHFLHDFFDPAVRHRARAFERIHCASLRRGFEPLVRGHCGGHGC